MESSLKYYFAYSFFKMNFFGNSLRIRNLAHSVLLQIQSIMISPSVPYTIQIPVKKERNSTDILKALKSTIKKDPTAPHYKYMDDPYLIPVSNLEKRSFALAKEAGRKAAMWIREQHSEFFQHKHAEPLIEPYLSLAVYTNKEQVSEDLLLNFIRTGNINDSMHIYKLLDGKVAIETKLALFELHCFYNSQQPIDEELIEERWFSVANQSTWISTLKVNSDRNELLKNLLDHGGKITGAAYNSMICGSAKYKNLYNAWELYEECKTKGIPICKTAYDYLIAGIGILKNSDDIRITTLLEMYQEMVKNNIKPDLLTLNASLSFAKELKEKKREIFVTILNEFEKMNVEPSLTSYYYVIEAFSSTKIYGEKVLIEILNKLEGQTLELRDPQDTQFFVKAMRIAHDCDNIILGKRIHELLLAHNNYFLIGDSYMESVYYRHFILLHLQNLSFDSFMKIYHEYVPNVYTPEVKVFLEILKMTKTLESKEAKETVLALFCQAVMFDCMRNQDVLSEIFDLMTGHCKPPVDSPLNKTFTDNAWTTWEQIQQIKATARRGYSYSASVLGGIAILLLRGGEFEKMLEILSVLMNSRNSVMGTVKGEYLKEIFESCLARGHTQAVLRQIKYAVEYDMVEGGEMARKAYQTLALSVVQEKELEALVGKNISKTKSIS